MPLSSPIFLALVLATTFVTGVSTPCAVAQVNSGASVVVFKADADGDIEPVRMISGPKTGLRWPQVLVVDRRGYLYISNYQNRDDDTVRVFGPEAAGDAAPSRMIAGPHSGVRRPVGLAIDDKDRLYVGNGGPSSLIPEDAITVYEAGVTGDAAPMRTLAGGSQYGMDWPYRLVFGRQDSLYVKSGGALSIFAPGAKDATEAVRYIVRSVPGKQYATLYSPQLFALDRHDSLYVVSGDSVMVYAPGYSGTEPAVRRLAGPRSGVHGVTDIILDDRGWLYLAERDASLIRVYAPGATGDVPPSRTIGGPRTRLSMPVGLALDRSRRLYVANWQPIVDRDRRGARP